MKFTALPFAGLLLMAGCSTTAPTASQQAIKPADLSQSAAVSASKKPHAGPRGGCFVHSETGNHRHVPC